MPFTDSCRSIRLDTDNAILILKAECTKNDGSYRSSDLDLDPCVSFDFDRKLRANDGWVAPNFHLAHNTDNVRNVRLQGTLLLADCAKPRGMLWWAWTEWIGSDLNLDDFVRANDGHLEFVHPKPAHLFPDWVPQLLDVLDGATKLNQDVWDRFQDDNEANLKRAVALGLEMNQAEWIAGGYRDGEHLVRRGT